MEQPREVNCIDIDNEMGWIVSIPTVRHGLANPTSKFLFNEEKG